MALTTTGPGAANTLGALGEAWASRQPVVVIATDIPTRLRRPGVWRGVLHEATDQAAMFEPVTKETIRVRSAAEIGEAIDRALVSAATSPSRPVYVEIPTDLLDEAVEEAPELRAQSPRAPARRRGAARSGRADGGELTPAAYLGRRRGPAGGSRRSGGAAGREARGAGDPHLLRVGPARARASLPGRGAPSRAQAGALWDEADVVVGIGTDFDGMMTQGWKQPQPARLVAVNVDPADAAKNYLPDVTLEADAALGVEQLTERIEQRGGLESLAARVGELNRSVRAGLGETDPAALAFLEAVERVLPADAVVLCDMCIPGYWLGGFARTPLPRKLSYPLGWGTLGCAFPQALGAALAGAGPVVSISGDGGFLYACGELAAAAQESIPFTAVIVDDGGYGMLRFDQDLKGDPHEGVDLQTPDFVALARSFGVRADIVEGLGEQFEGTLGHHVRVEEPTVLVAKAALGPPPNVSPRWYRR